MYVSLTNSLPPGSPSSVPIRRSHNVKSDLVLHFIGITTYAYYLRSRDSVPQMIGILVHCHRLEKRPGGLQLQLDRPENGETERLDIDIYMIRAAWTTYLSMYEYDMVRGNLQIALYSCSLVKSSL